MPKPLVIANIQVLRAFAALAVVFYHTNFRFIADVHTDLQGVSLFFVISGFIMCYITTRDRTSFLSRRLTRIVPLYWCMTLLTFVGYIAGYWLKHGQIHIAGNGGIAGLLKSLFFIPYQDGNGAYFPTLAVGWTLNLEMLFYLLIAILLPFFQQRAVMVAGLVLLLLHALCWLAGSPHNLLGFYAHRYTLYFVFGIAVYYLWQWLLRFPLASRPALLFPIAVVTALFFLAVNLSGGSSYFLCVLVVLLALLLSSAGKDCNYRPLLLLGDASYAIYLVHLPVQAVLRYLSLHIPVLEFEHHLSGFVIAMLASCLAGIAVHLRLEKPLIKWMRRFSHS